MPADPMDTPTLVAVAEGFCVRQAVDNTAWIDLGEWAVVVDALEQPQLEKEVIEAIESTLGDKPVRYVINTHPHGDHTALNRAFRRRWGAEILNQRTSPAPPQGRWLEGTRRRVQILPMGGCHTDDDLVVWVPEDKALFVGDIFGWGLIPLSRSLTDRTMKLLTDTYARLIDFAAVTVVPGHGPNCTTAELARQVEYYRWLVEQVSIACAAGRSDEEIAAEAAPPEDMHGWWRFLLWKHEDSLGKVLAAVRAGRLGAAGA